MSSSESEPKVEPWPRSGPEAPDESEKFGMPLWVLRFVQGLALLGIGAFVLGVLLILVDLAS